MLHILSSDGEDDHSHLFCPHQVMEIFSDWLLRLEFTILMQKIMPRL